MDKTALLYYKSALSLKLPLTVLQQIAGFEIKLGKRRYFFRGGETPFNCGSSISVASNKFCMNKILNEAGFPTPKAVAYNKYQFENNPIETLIEDLSFPLVVKPMSGTACGLDVLCNINTITQLKTYMKKCYKKHTFLSIEEFHHGLNSYRVLIFYNKVIGVVQRFPARVVGDGIHSIQELIAINNQERDKFKNKVSLGPIKIDDEMNIRLQELHLTLDSILQDKETVVLAYTCNSSRGGSMQSLGKAICKENAHLLCKAAKALDLNIVGFDVACDNILVPMETSGGVIIEANHNPDISIHEHPLSGIQHRVSKTILQRLIWKHPVAYFLGLYHNKTSATYVRVILLVFTLMAWNLMLIWNK